MTTRYIVEERPGLSPRIYPTDTGHGYAKEELPDVISDILTEELSRVQTLTADELIDEYS